MKLKIGDKVLCKKNFNCYGGGRVNFFNGRCYYIKNIVGGLVMVVDDNSNTWWFEGDDPDPINFWNDIWIYFYTKKEVRQLKLEQIDGI